MTNGNESASPLTAGLLDKQQQGHFNNAGERRPFGLTKREHFAAMAMQGIISIENALNCLSYENMAERSVDAADALIKALNKQS